MFIIIRSGTLHFCWRRWRILCRLFWSLNGLPSICWIVDGISGPSIWNNPGLAQLRRRQSTATVFGCRPPTSSGSWTSVPFAIRMHVPLPHRSIEINRPTAPLLCADSACFLSCADLHIPTSSPSPKAGTRHGNPRALWRNISAANLIT